MSRVFDVILMLALVAGLAVFLDPSLRDKAMDSWQEAKPIIIEWRERAQVQFREWTAADDSWIEIVNREERPLNDRTEDEPVIQINLGALKESLLRIWAEIKLRIAQLAA
jgi:hypothetical protein